MKNWAPDIYLLAKDVKMVPTWVRCPRLPLKLWGQSALHKIGGMIGTLVRSYHATA